MPTLSYGRALSLQAERKPHEIALVCAGTQLTRLALDRWSNQLARAYAEAGVAADDFVTIALPNCPEFIAATFAIWKLGATPQPVSSHLPHAERDAIIELAAPSLIVGVEPGTHGERPSLAADFDASAFDAGPVEDRVSTHRMVICSGGSTGRPKLIVDALRSECDPDEPFYGIEPGTRLLVPGPLYHAGPFINFTVAALGGGFVAVMERFDAAEALRLIDEHRLEWVNLVPTMMQRIWRLPEAERQRYDLSSLRRVMSSGAACPPWLKREWIDWLGPERIWESYGGSERIGGTTISGTEWLERPGSVGKPTFGRKLKIVGEDGEELAAGEIGEVYFLPPGGQGSTYHYVGAEARATQDGWETLGDLGYVDEDGFLYLSDRRTDMVVTGGANVYPAEVEGAIEAHPNVHSCAVIGLPDDDLGARVHAIVEARPPVAEEALRAHLAERLVRYKIPRSFEFVDSPLRDDAGKVRRSALRAERMPS